VIHHAPAVRGAGLSKPATRVRLFSRWTGRAGSVLAIPHPGYRTMYAPRPSPRVAGVKVIKAVSSSR